MEYKLWKNGNEKVEGIEILATKDFDVFDGDLISNTKKLNDLKKEYPDAIVVANTSRPVQLQKISSWEPSEFFGNERIYTGGYTVYTKDGERRNLDIGYGAPFDYIKSKTAVLPISGVDRIIKSANHRSAEGVDFTDMLNNQLGLMEFVAGYEMKKGLSTEETIISLDKSISKAVETVETITRTASREMPVVKEKNHVKHALEEPRKIKEHKTDQPVRAKKPARQEAPDSHLEIGDSKKTRSVPIRKEMEAEQQMPKATEMKATPAEQLFGPRIKQQRGGMTQGQAQSQGFKQKLVAET